MTRWSRPPVRSRSLRPSTGQDQCRPPADDVRPVELRRDLDREVGPAHRLLDDGGVRRRGGEVASHADEDPRRAVPQGAYRVDGVVAVLSRRFEVELVLQRVEEVVRDLLPDAHRPVALDVGVPADRAEAGSRLADVALGEGEVGDLLDRRDGVAVLGDPHGPAGHGALRGGQQVGRLLDERSVQAGGHGDGIPVERAHVVGPGVEPGRVLRDEVEVQHGARTARRTSGVLLGDQQRAEGLEQREVAAYPDRQVQVGQLRPDAGQAPRRLGVAEPGEPGLRQGVDRDDLRAPLLRDLEGGEHARMVGARVLADDEDQLGVVDVLEAHAALADAGHLGQRHRRRLVAHVGAVRQVVGAERPDEQLVEERRLVRGTARGVEDGLVRAVQTAQRRTDDPVRVGPVDRRVVRGPFPPHHRVGQPALLAEPVAGVLLEVVQRVGREELWTDLEPGPLLRHRLGPVLTELGGMPVLRVRIRPGAAGAVEPLDLVEPEQAAGRVADAHRSHGPVHRDGHRGHTRGHLLVRRHRELGLVDVVHRRGLDQGHAGHGTYRAER